MGWPPKIDFQTFSIAMQTYIITISRSAENQLNVRISSVTCSQILKCIIYIVFNISFEGLISQFPINYFSPSAICCVGDSQ